jgi:hypothetical protein
MKELARLISERKYEEAFVAALHRSDVSIVSWLCSQVCDICHKFFFIPNLKDMSFLLECVSLQDIARHFTQSSKVLQIHIIFKSPPILEGSQILSKEWFCSLTSKRMNQTIK